MQINFHFSPKDEDLLLNYIFDRSGYFVAYHGRKQFYETFFSQMPNSDEPKYRFLNLFRKDYAPVDTIELNWKNQIKYRHRHRYASLVADREFFDDVGYKVEFIEYTRCIAKDGKLLWGRFWMNGLDAEAIKFYRNICSYIRKNSYKIDRWEWIGNHVEDYISEHNLQLGQFAYGPSV